MVKDVYMVVVFMGTVLFRSVLFYFLIKEKSENPV